MERTHIKGSPETVITQCEVSGSQLVVNEHLSFFSPLSPLLLVFVLTYGAASMSQASNVQTPPGVHEHTPQGRVSGEIRISVRLFLCPGFTMRGAESGSV